MEASRFYSFGFCPRSICPFALYSIFDGCLLVRASTLDFRPFGLQACWASGFLGFTPLELQAWASGLLGFRHLGLCASLGFGPLWPQAPWAFGLLVFRHAQMDPGRPGWTKMDLDGPEWTRTDLDGPRQIERTWTDPDGCFCI